MDKIDTDLMEFVRRIIQGDFDKSLYKEKFFKYENMEFLLTYWKSHVDIHGEFPANNVFIISSPCNSLRKCFFWPKRDDMNIDHITDKIKSCLAEMLSFIRAKE